MPSLIALAEPVAALLKQRGETVAVSESSFGRLITVAGLVSYSTVLETGDGDREANMWRFTETALQVFEKILRGAG